MVPAQTAGNMRKNDVTVVKFDGKGRARKHLLDAAEDFERRFSIVLRDLRLGCAGVGITISSCDYGYSFALRKQQYLTEGIPGASARDPWEPEKGCSGRVLDRPARPEVEVDHLRERRFSIEDEISVADAGHEPGLAQDR